MQSIAQRALTAVGLLCVLGWDAAPSHAADPAPTPNSIYDGQWSCEFRFVTKPGGVIFADCINNTLFTVVKSSFQVDKSGSFSWEERKNGHYHMDNFCTNKEFSCSFDQEAILKVAGQVVDTKTRTLKVTVECWQGSGRLTNSMGGGTIAVAADGSSDTWFTGDVTDTHPRSHPHWVYKVKPVSVEQQDLGPDQQREIVTYKVSEVSGRTSDTTLHIEIRQVRELKLVPRG